MDGPLPWEATLIPIPETTRVRCKDPEKKGEGPDFPGVKPQEFPGLWTLVNEGGDESPGAP